MTSCSPTRRLHIAFVVDRFGNRFGGAEAYGVELVRQLIQHHDVTVFAREYDPACAVAAPFVPLSSWKHWPSWVRVLLFAIRARQKTRTGFDVVHSHMNGWCGDIEVIHVTPVRYNWRVRPLSWLKKLTSFISPRVQTYLQLERKRVAPRPAHRTVAVSELIATQLRQAYGDDQAYPVIPPGVVPPERHDHQTIQKVRADLQLSDNDFVALMVARNPIRKGLPTVLEAMKHLPDHYKLVVVGSTPATREFIHGAAGYPELAHRIRLIPPTPHVSVYYQLAQIYVHPTRNDSFGMAPLEALSYGLPVIISPMPWCGFAQYVQHETDALLLDHPENALELAQYMQRVATDSVLQERLRQGAHAVVQRHGWDQVAAQYLELYDQVLAERGVPAARS